MPAWGGLVPAPSDACPGALSGRNDAVAMLNGGGERATCPAVAVEWRRRGDVQKEIEFQQSRFVVGDRFELTQLGQFSVIVNNRRKDLHR